MSATTVSRDAVLEQLAKIQASGTFEGAVRSRALLEFLVCESVDGRAEQLKEYSIGSKGLGRGDSFDPRIDPIVRAEASRLRVRLERYYSQEGKSDAVLIVLHKGNYVPQFVTRTVHEETSPASESPVRAEAGQSLRLTWIAVAAMVATGAGFYMLWAGSRVNRLPERRMIQFDAELRSGGMLGSEVGTDVVLSGDGTAIVFVATGSDSVPHLYYRKLEESRTPELPGTDGARSPFFSPDGAWVGFWAAGKIKKVAVGGGSPVVLGETTDLVGASWGEDG